MSYASSQQDARKYSLEQPMNSLQFPVQQKSATVTDQIRHAHDALDRLTGAVGSLDERLAPVLSYAQPTGEGSTGNQAASEPPAIEELNRLISRLHTLASRVDDLVLRTRV